MKNVLVSYQVEKEYVEKNKANIAVFLKDFENMDSDRFSYIVYLQDDGVTFMHLSNYADSDIQNDILNTPSFLEFQRQRDESGLNNSHEVKILEFIGASQDLF